MASGLKITKTSTAKLGGLSTQAIPIESNATAANAITLTNLSEPLNGSGVGSINTEKNKATQQLLPVVSLDTISSAKPIKSVSLEVIPKGIPTGLGSGIPNVANVGSGISNINTKNLVSNFPTRTARGSMVSISKDAIPSVRRILPPQPDSLRISELSIENENFENTNMGGMSAFRPEILGLINFNPIFWPENKSEFTEAGQMISVNFQNHFLRNSTIDSVFQKIKTSNNPQLLKNFNTLVDKNTNSFVESESVIRLLANNHELIGQIKDAFEIKGINTKSFKTNKFDNFKDFFERKMQYSNDSFNSFSDTKILMQMLFDLRSSLEGYSLSLLNLEDSDRKNDYNPILLDKTYTKTNNFSFSIDSIKSTGINGRLATDSAEFTQFLNSLPSEPNSRLRLLIHLLNKELRVSKGLSKVSVRNTLANYYSGGQDGNPFDNIIGQLGGDIFEDVSGTNSLASLLQLKQQNFTVLPFETKTVDDSQTTYVPGARFFGDSLLNLVNQKLNIQPFNNYNSVFSDVVSKAKTTINEIFDLDAKDSELKPDTFFLNLLQSIQDGLVSLSSNSNAINGDQLVFSALLRLANKDIVLKQMLFQYFLLSGIASNNKFTKKKIFSKLIEDVRGQINRFSYVRVAVNENPDLNAGLQTLRPYLEKLAVDIENKVFQLINPMPGIPTEISPIIKNATATTNDRFSFGDGLSKLPFGATVEKNQKISSGINPGIQTKAINSTVPSSTKIENSKTLKSNIFDRGSIKNILINGINATGTAGTNLMKEFIDFADKMDKISSIQGNQLSYLLENNSTRFNFVSVSYLLLFLFEIFSAFTNRFFVCDFVDTTDFTKLILSFDQTQNSIMFDYISELTQDKKIAEANPLASKYFKQTIEPNPTQTNKTSISPAFSSVIKSATKNSQINPIGVLNQIVTNVFGGVSANTVQEDAKSAGSIKTSNSLSVMLETIGSLKNSKSNVGIGSFGQKIGSAGAVTKSFQSQTVGVESIKNAIQSGLFPKSGIETFNVSNMDVLFIRKINSLKDNLNEIRAKVVEEDLFFQNILHIFEVIADRITLVNSKVNSAISKLNSESIRLLGTFKQTSSPSQLRVANWIYRTYKENSSNLGSFNSVYQDEFYALTSFLSNEFYNKNLASNRVKLLVVGVPNGFSNKLIDRTTKNDITNTNFKDLDADLISVSVYRKNNVNDDIVYHPQKFIFDLSLFPKEMNGIGVDPRMSFEKQLSKFNLLDFSDLSSFDGKQTDLSSILNNEKYNFLTAEDKKIMFQNHIASYLLQTYVYLLSGFSFSEEVFPIQAYSQLGPTILDSETELLIRNYFRFNTGVDYPGGKSIANVLTDSSISDDLKDDIQLLLYGSNYTRSALVKEKTLNAKKFDRVFIVPVNIDDFIVNTEETLQTSSGKRMYMKQSYQNELQEIKIGSTQVFKENRESKKDALILDDLFVTLETVRKV